MGKVDKIMDMATIGIIVIAGAYALKFMGGLGGLKDLFGGLAGGGGNGGGGIESQQVITPSLIESIVTEPQADVFEITAAPEDIPAAQAETLDIGNTLVQGALAITKVNPITAPLYPIISSIVGYSSDRINEMLVADISQPTETWEYRKERSIELFGEYRNIGGR